MKRTVSAGDGSAGTERAGLPETVELSTGPKPCNTVIWLHGLGADGHDFEPIVPYLGMDSMAATRFVFPHAPVRPVTINGGMRMRAWYDIRGMQVSRDQDEAGIEHSAALVRALIARENERGIPCSRIVLAGFSQGGAIAVHVALRYPERLAGLLALSTYLLFPDRLAAERSRANADVPVFVGHGSLDPTVPLAMGQALVDTLQALACPVTWRRYPIPHSVSQEEIDDTGAWLRATLGQHG
jgi:phospholipase/carboxylesterase